ncbi:AAA family ATPase [Janibacter sp. CX7]|uniref:AAA family ATPase n=1 Tax=Janibacter sp. CX7 TaxID=2963431 RepID=UPI0020CD88C3|nr:AAA family ATPase [Janibacter sp. CX7]UTT65118.1 AAA family ATPase [Janibacter sp. CX7]
MLTRLEVTGFKNLIDFSVDFGPFTCIAGPNAVGKSNIFDAIEFLSLLADKSFMEAAQLLRSDGPAGGDPRALFWRNAEGESPAMVIAAEMIVPSEVEDDFGRTTRPTMTFLRYELELGYVRPQGGSFSRLGRIELRRESLVHITHGEAPSHIKWPHSKRNFRDAVLKGRRSGVAFISTDHSMDEATIRVHADGGSRGQPRTSPAANAPRTVVSTTTAYDDPTILAARREMQQWRQLALEPSSMRTPDSANDPDHIASDGGHLASSLYRLARTKGEQVYAEIAASAAALTDVREIAVDIDERRELLTLEARMGSGLMLPARSMSDGTLRFLALCIMAQDDEVGGLICMEEPENGIHPAKIQEMVELVRDLAVDPTEAPGPDNPLRQVMVNTHSPHFVQFQEEADLLLAVPLTVRTGEGPQTTVGLMHLAGTWRGDSVERTISRATIMDYLTLPDDAPLTLDF